MTQPERQTADAELFQRIGAALYGRNWHDGFARELGVNSSSVRNWAHGRNVIPDGVWRDIAELASARQTELAAVLRALACKALPTRLTTRGRCCQM